MSDQYVAEIRIFGFGFAPRGWAVCAGQLMAIQQNTALFSLLGTTYGGNGTTTFALPNLMGALPIHMSVYDLGETGGSTTVTILSEEMAAHSHSPVATTATGTVVTSAGSQPAKAFFGTLQGNTQGLFYSSVATPATQLPNQTLGALGGNQPHNNMMPTLFLNYCIALQGNFPARN
jgi:microcystin-dependent protein